MASSLETSHNIGSDVVYDVCCSICEDDGIYKEGRFHCQKCSNYFCDSCVLTHNKFHKHHSVTTKGGGDNWPVTTTVDDTLEFCEIHTTEKLTMFCEDDEKLLCHVCHLRNHKQCSEVVLLTDKVKSSTQSLDTAQIKTSLESCMKRLEDMVKIGEQNSMSLQTSYEKVLEEILDVRRRINDNLDRLQHNTERKLKELHSTLKYSLEKLRKQCIEFISKIKGYNIKDIHTKSPERSFIMYRKYLDQTASADLFLQKSTTHAAIEFQHNKDFEQFLASCTEFGIIASREDVSHHRIDPNTIVSVKETSRYKVRKKTDKNECHITGICESSSGELIIADFNNQCLKYLNRAYNSIEKIQIPKLRCSIISSNEMAIIVGNGYSDKAIDFLRVDKGKTVKFNTLHVNTNLCFSIAIHQDDIFVTSGVDVSQYTMDGRLVKKLYEDKSGEYPVIGVGVSLDGKKIFVTDSHKGKLLTLSRNGVVTATLQDPALRTSYTIPNIHVAARGQVFVFGKQSISQIDTNGERVRNTIKLDMFDPSFVYFNESTCMMLVGFCHNDNIIEFKTMVS